MGKLDEAMKRIRCVAECLDDNDPDKQEMLDVEGDYSQLMEWAIKKRNEALQTSLSCKDLALTYTARQKRYETRADNMKDICGILLDCAREEKYEGAGGTVFKRKNPDSVDIEDEDRIAKKFKTIETKVKIDKKAIKAALSAGEEVAGAKLIEGQKTTQIKI